MGYAHLFYRIDLQRLRTLFGAGDAALARAVLKKQADDVENNDLFFEEEIAEGTCPDTKTALAEIFAGRISSPHRPAMYGYTLKILCEHIGKDCGEEVAAVGEHPYESQLADSGPPIPIPYDPGDFPEIGYLPLADIAAEIARLDAAPRVVRPPFRSLRTDAALAYDLDNYRTTLAEVLKKKSDLISFRH